MQVTFGPKVARRVLRYELERLCEQAGVNHTQVGQRLGMSRAAFGHVLGGKNMLSKPAMEVLMEFIGRTDRLPMLLELLAASKIRPGRQAAMDGRPISSTNDFELAIGLESFATGIEAFEPMLIHGLLQTEDYARALIGYHASFVPGVDVEQSVAVRMRRQSVVTRDHSPAQLWCVMEEQALRRPVGDKKVMRQQLDHLIRVSTWKNITLQVMPRNVGLHPSLKGPFFLLRFEDDWQVAYEETRRSAYYYDSTEAVEDYGQAMDRLRHLALDLERSQDLLMRLRGELK